MKTVQTISRRNCLCLGAGAAMASLIAPAARAAGAPQLLVELFSSQGCSSCKGAERLFTELTATPGVLAISYHVDYWDYLGWKDTLASAEFSQRQYDYAKARGDMDVYTPQIIVNGGRPMVGSQRSEVYAVTEQARKSPWPVAVSLSGTDKEFTVEIGAGQGEGTLWVMPILPEAKVRIEKGEMAGEEMTYRNVVRRLVPAGMWKGEAARMSLPRDGLMPPECTACVALLQEGKVGRVLGAAVWGSLVS